MKKPLTKSKAGRRPELQPLARAIQNAMRSKGLDVPALTEALGMEKSQRGGVAHWVAGKNGPGDMLRPKLAQILGLSEAELTSPRKKGGRKPMTLQGQGPAQRAVALVETAKLNGELLPAAPPVTDVFVIRARSDGSMVVRLDASLSFVKGAQLAQFLLGFGLVTGVETEGPGS
jgi:hypothetical protein